MIELIYTNTVEQWVNCACFSLEKSRDEKKLNRPRIFLTSACAVIFFITLFLKQFLISLVFGLLGIIFYFLYPKLIMEVTKIVFRRMGRKKDLLPKGDIKVVLNESTIQVEIEEKLRILEIDEVKDLTEISGCLFIEFKNKDEISLIIPIDAFKDKEERRVFEERIKK